MRVCYIPVSSMHLHSKSLNRLRGGVQKNNSFVLFNLYCPKLYTDSYSQSSLNADWGVGGVK